MCCICSNVPEHVTYCIFVEALDMLPATTTCTSSVMFEQVSLLSSTGADLSDHPGVGPLAASSELETYIVYESHDSLVSSRQLTRHLRRNPAPTAVSTHYAQALLH